MEIAGAVCRAGPKTVQASRLTKALHLVLFIISIILILLFQFRFPTLADSSSPLARRLADDAIGVFRGCDTLTCFAMQAATRIAFGTFAYFITLAFAALYSARIHFGYLVLKAAAWFAFILGAFLIPNAIADALRSWSETVAAVFLVHQSIILISFAANSNAALAAHRRLRPAIFIVFALINLLTIAFLFYHHISESIAITFLIVNAGFSAASFLLSRNSSLITTAIITAYTTLLLHRALSSGANYVGIALAAIIITYRSLSMAPTSIFGATSSPDAHDDVLLTLPTTISAGSARLTTPVAVAERWAPAEFYFLMALGIVYALTVSVPAPPTNNMAVAAAAMTATLYLWALCAPRLLKTRDFGVNLDS